MLASLISFIHRTGRFAEANAKGIFTKNIYDDVLVLGIDKLPADIIKYVMECMWPNLISTMNKCRKQNPAEEEIVLEF